MIFKNPERYAFYLSRIEATAKKVHQHVRALHDRSEKQCARSMVLALEVDHISCVREATIPNLFLGHKLSNFRIDLLVEDAIVVELKVGPEILSEHFRQAYTYMEFARIPYGMLIN